MLKYRKKSPYSSNCYFRTVTFSKQFFFLIILESEKRIRFQIQKPALLLNRQLRPKR